MTLKQQFNKHFKEGMEFWTSEDGSLMSVVICFSPDWVRILKERVECRGEKFNPSRVRKRFAYKEWAETDYWYFSGQKGKVWRTGESPTEFPVYEYEFETPK